MAGVPPHAAAPSEGRAMRGERLFALFLLAVAALWVVRQ